MTKSAVYEELNEKNITTKSDGYNLRVMTHDHWKVDHSKNMN
ncbi:MAG: hypothetical protein ACFFD7_00160 [Candidatus Thorarchaeota archaeon]